DPGGGKQHELLSQRDQGYSGPVEAYSAAGERPGGGAVFCASGCASVEMDVARIGRNFDRGYASNGRLYRRISHHRGRSVAAVVLAIAFGGADHALSDVCAIVGSDSHDGFRQASARVVDS